MSVATPYKIFISYRRDDSQATVDHIYEWLVRAFGRDAIFMDVDSIPVGYSFPGYVNGVLRQCRVALIVLGSSWPTVIAHEGAHKGQPRVLDPADNVRVEVEQALTLATVSEDGRPVSDLLLIPLLVQGAGMPNVEQLPESLRELTKRNATTIRRNPDFEHDVQRLIANIAAWIGVAIPNPSSAATTLPPIVSPTPPATDPIDDLLARFLPQLRAAFSEQKWPQVVRLAEFIQRSAPTDRCPLDVYMLQGQALLAERDFAGAKLALDIVRQRDPLDIVALRAAADARIALREWAEALPLLNDALTITGERSQRVPLLRIYATVLTEVARTESSTQAMTHWSELLRVANEGLLLAGEQDIGYLAAKLNALSDLQCEGEALDLARYLTATQAVTAADWLTRARLAWKLAGESPTDEVRAALDAAMRLAPNDIAVIEARQQLLVILPPVAITSQLAKLGFSAARRNGVAFIVPPICMVTTGEFLMGSNPRRDNQARPDEQPQSRIMVATFSIGRCPVTVAEYACFVATGYRDPNEWQNQLKWLDHPVVNTSWDDAIAYATWLSGCTGQPWRLPTEAEWEKAARWDARNGVARIYPWGDMFDQTRANTYKSRRGTMTPVGIFPNGASPYGALDMIGNIFEWVHSLYKPYPYTVNDGREVAGIPEKRVLRGGSWNSNAGFVRAASRIVDWPTIADNHVGFRLVLASTDS